MPSPQTAIDAKEDLWAQAAMRQPNGASYELFKGLLPPLRYCNAEFPQYPIVLSAPRSQVKPRLVSNGSAINAKANGKMWREVGVPVRFGVGGEGFGADMSRLDGPHLDRGYLPIVGMTYRVGDVEYTEEVFASTDATASQGALLAQFGVKRGAGEVRASVDAPGLQNRAGFILDSRGRVVLIYGPMWSWDEANRALVARLQAGQEAPIAIFTSTEKGVPFPPMTTARYALQRRACIATWEAVLARAVKLETPETVVNNAWRALVINNLMIARGDWMCYSEGNLYDHLYESECGDAAHALALYGLVDDARDFLGPLLDFQRQATRYHVAGLKLQNLANYYWLTRDVEYVRARRASWQQAAELLIKDREKESGLMPRTNYCGDINQQVYSLSSNALAWRGLRDLSAVLREIGATADADRYAKEAGEYRTAIIKAVEKSEFLNTKPPFIPMALFGEEQPVDSLTSTKLGSYYDLIAPYVIGTEVFGRQSVRQTWMIDYLRQHGGLFAGMIRCEPHQGEFDGEPGVNPLYGLPYTLECLQRDERELSLVSYYAHLALALTPETFVGGEGTRLRHGDAQGRSFYLPPNSASNGFSLTVLRYLLIQDWDMDEDGRPETLRLLYGVPRRWLEDGKTFAMQGAPTAFGKVSVAVRSQLATGAVEVKVTIPERPMKQVSLRLPLPEGYKVVSAEVTPPPEKGAAARGWVGRLNPEDDGAVDLTGRTGEFTIRFGVGKTGQ
jgi:hypothetical protein